MVTKNEDYNRVRSRERRTEEKLKTYQDQEKDSKKKAEEERRRDQDRHHNHRYESISINKRPREDLRDGNKRSTKRTKNNNNTRNRSGNLSKAPQTLVPHPRNDGVSGSIRSPSRSPPAPSPPPTNFQEIDHPSQQEHAPFFGPPTDPRTQPKKKQNDEEHEEGEYPTKKSAF